MRTILLWLLCSIAVAQDPWQPVDSRDEAKIVQVSFLVADAVELASEGKRTAILAENLDSKREYGVLLIADEKAKWIEIHSDEKPFPPSVLQPYKDNRFLIRGEPGQKYYVSIRGEGLPVWVEVVVAPSVEPDKPPPVVPPPPQPVDDLTKLSRDLATAMQDEKTRSELKTSLTAKVKEIQSLCSQNKCPTLDVAKREVMATIDRTFLARTTPNKKWLEGWRDPVSKAVAVNNPTTTAAYVATILAVAEGL